ncbi:MAG: HlyD family efflux transporter periplasmic adaptor subunit [Anaerolineales bacterium]|nr:HlyD family efflux transporter periplasmic adaptor subunit [Anaerolineales bacterium]
MTANRLRNILLLAFLITMVVVAIVYLYSVSGVEEAGLRASGTVESVEVLIAPEVAGRVEQVLVGEADLVDVGDPLVKLDTELLQAQRARAAAAVETAEAALRNAEANLAVVHTQVEITRRAARFEHMPVREEAWEEASPGEFELPIWYYVRSEEIAAAETEVRAALEELEEENASLEAFIEDLTMEDLLAAETRLVDARNRFLIADEVLERARRARDDQVLEDYAEQLYDAAEDELEAAQSDYEQLLSDKEAEDLLDVRARLAVVQERYDSALDRLAELQSGEFSLQVLVVEQSLEQAHAAVVQAEAALRQAAAELTVISLQLEKYTLYAPASGVVATRNVEPGEVVQPGVALMTLYQLEKMTITVFVPEDQYGRIILGQRVIVTVDSFPDETFSATVTHIADRAEFTPRNVQTQEGRRTTVFAVELVLEDLTGRLKPGMPADVDFGE